MSQIDLGLARRIAEERGLSYQSYLKSILHEGIEKDRAARARRSAD
jgi:hypothetical protein